MPIDGIGKKGGIGAGADVGNVAPASDASRAPFDANAANVDRTDKSAAIAPTNPTPLDRLKSGDIHLDAYLDIKVDEATKHLAALPPKELSDVRKMLRDRLATDPLLADLVKSATGSLPKPQDE
jgi:hypothetical protein